MGHVHQLLNAAFIPSLSPFALYRAIYKSMLNSAENMYRKGEMAFK